MEELQPGAKYLPQVSDDLATITVNGVRRLQAPLAHDAEVHQLVHRARRLRRRPAGPAGSEGSRLPSCRFSTSRSAYITPAQTVCNYAGLFARNIASAVGGRDSTVGFLRFGLFTIAAAPPANSNAEVGPASQPSSFSQGANNSGGNFLHANPYPIHRPGRNLRGRQRVEPRQPAMGQELKHGSEPVATSGHRQPVWLPAGHRYRRHRGRRHESGEEVMTLHAGASKGMSRRKAAIVAGRDHQRARLFRVLEGHPVHPRLPDQRLLHERRQTSSPSRRSESLA